MDDLRDYTEKLKRIASGTWEPLPGDVDDPIEEKRPPDPGKDDYRNDDQSISEHHQTAISTLERCGHLLASPSHRRRQLLLSIINHSIYALSDNTRRLLPAVATVWKSYQVLLRERDKATVLQVSKVLRAMCEFAASFLTRRFKEHIWPAIIDILRAQDVSLKKQLSHTDVEKSVEVTIMVTLLECLTTLSSYRDMVLPVVDQIITGCVEYLSAHRPAPIVKQCLLLFERLVILDEDLVLWELNLRWPQREIPDHTPSALPEFKTQAEFIYELIDSLREPTIRGNNGLM